MGLKRVSPRGRPIASGGRKPLGVRKALAEDTPIAFWIWRMLMGSSRYAMCLAVLALVGGMGLPSTARAQAPAAAAGTSPDSAPAAAAPAPAPAAAPDAAPAPAPPPAAALGA